MSGAYIPGLDAHFDAKLNVHIRESEANEERADAIEEIANSNFPRVSAAVITRDKTADDVVERMHEGTDHENWVRLLRAVVSGEKESVFSIAKEIMNEAIQSQAELDAEEFIKRIENENP